MTDEVKPGLSDQYRKASPWPVFVALGFVVSEIGVVLGFFPVTVGGLVLFGGTVAGILSEADYVARPWLSLVGFGALALVLGVVAVGLNADLAALSLESLLDPARPFVYRGSAIGVAGIMLVAAGVTIALVEPDVS